MQLFVQLCTTGKTVSVDVQATWTLQQVIDNVNSRFVEDNDTPFNLLIYKKSFYEEEHPMNVTCGTLLDNNTPLVSLYSNGVIKEILLLAGKLLD